nr:glycosyltransferase family 2 protein [uncultured Clostridium sp.]
MKQLITVIAPMYNEEEIVEEYCTATMAALDISNYTYEILLVNDGSKDGTLLKMQMLQERYPNHIGIINLTRNFGLEGAIYAGIRMAVGNIVVVMDADLQDPPELILEMLKKYESGADIVIANREKRKNDNLFKRVTASIYYRVLDSLSGKIHLERGAANYRLLSGRALEKLRALPEVNGVFRVTVPFLGMKTETVIYSRNQRFAGKTKYNLKSMIRYALDSLTGISIEPLRKISLMLPIAGIIFLLNIIGMIVSDGYWKGFFYIGVLISIFFAFGFAALALIGEYIGQIMIESKHRPTSLIYSYDPSLNGKEFS